MLTVIVNPPAAAVWGIDMVPVPVAVAVARLLELLDIADYRLKLCFR